MSAGRPGHGTSADDVAVQVKDALPGVRPFVNDEAISGCPQAELFGDLPRGDNHSAKKHRVGLCGSMYSIDMLFWNDERMRRRDRSDVAEGEQVLVLEENFRRCLSSRNLTK